MEETTGRQLDSSAVIHVALILIMKLCSQAVEAYFSRMDPHNFGWVNGSCELVAENSAHATEYWAYLLPVLGGLLSTVCLGYILVMQLGGFAFVLTSVLMTIASGLGWLCSNSQPSHALWVLPTLSAGIAEPAIFYGMFRWHWRCPRIRTIVCALLFLCDKIGEHLGTLPWSEIMGKNHIMFAIASSLLYIVLSFSLQEYSHESPSVVPNLQRIVRYAKIFSALTPFIAVLANYHWEIYTRELKALGGIDLAEDWSLSLRSPSVFGLAGNFVTVLATVCLSCLYTLPIQGRIFAGIILELLCSTFLAIFTAAVPIFATPSDFSLLNIWLLVSLFDGVARCLTTVAYFDFLDSITNQDCKPFVIGILLTIWGLGGTLSKLCSLAFDNIPIDNPVGNPTSGKVSLFFVYHLVSIGLLSISLVYHRFCSLRWSETLTEPEDAD